MNPERKTLVEAATRPFADDAEMHAATAGLLDQLLPDPPSDTGEVLSRWNTLDGRDRRGTPWRTALFILLGIALASLVPTAVSLVRELTAYRSLRSTATGTTVSLKTGKGRSALSPEARWVLYGDETHPDRAGSAKARWDRDPSDVVLFAAYVTEFLADTATLPPDFLETSRKLDPSNAWFLHLAAAVEAKGAVRKKTQSSAEKAAKAPIEWEILDAASMERALALLKQARELPECRDYKLPWTRRRIPFLPQSNFIELSLSMAYLAGDTAPDLIAMRHLADSICAKASLTASAGDASAFQSLSTDAEAFLRKSIETEASSIVAGLVARTNMESISRAFAHAAKKLGLENEAARYDVRHAAILRSREAAKGAKLSIEGSEFGRKGSLLTCLTIPMIHRQVATPPPIRDSDLEPMRLMEHEAVSIISALCLLILLAVGMGVATGLHFRHAKPVRRLSRRIESLLTGSDWGWIVFAGVLTPMLWTLSLNRLTPFGGREFSVAGTLYTLPNGHYLALWLQILVLAIVVLRWRLVKRARALGLEAPHPLPAWIATSAALLLPVALGAFVHRPSSSIGFVVVALGLIPASWLLGVFGKLFFVRSVQLLAITTARAIIPPLALAMIFTCALIPYLAISQKRCFANDRFLKPDERFPSMLPYEYKAAVQLQKETAAAFAATP